MEEEKTKNCMPLAVAGVNARLPPCLFLFVPCTRIFRAKVVYMVLGSVPSARIFLSLSSYREEDPIAGAKYQLFAYKLNRENISMALG